MSVAGWGPKRQTRHRHPLDPHVHGRSDRSIPWGRRTRVVALDLAEQVRWTRLMGPSGHRPKNPPFVAISWWLPRSISDERGGNAWLTKVFAVFR